MTWRKFPAAAEEINVRVCALHRQLFYLNWMYFQSKSFNPKKKMTLKAFLQGRDVYGPFLL